jgi:hypothetical protein
MIQSYQLKAPLSKDIRNAPKEFGTQYEFPLKDVRRIYSWSSKENFTYLTDDQKFEIIVFIINRISYKRQLKNLSV